MVPPLPSSARRSAVLVVTPHYTTKNDSVALVVERLIAELSSSNQFHFTWAASDSDSLPTIKGQIILPMKPPKFLQIIGSKYFSFWNHRSRKQLSCAIQGVDCVWLHDTFSLGTIAAYRAAKKWNKPIFITLHKGPTLQGNFMRLLVTRLIDYFITRKMLASAMQTTFTSDTVAEYYYHRIAFTMPVKIIPNGVDLSVSQPPLPEKRRNLRARFALRKEQPVLLFVGNFFTSHGLLVIKQLAETMPEWRFWLAGNGKINPEKWFLPNLQVFKERGTTSLTELYQAADLLILPGYGQDFPIAAQEAIACGLPVMCSASIADSSRFAKPYLWSVKVNSTSSKRTALLWAEKLKAGRHILPLNEAKSELSNLAQSYWAWPKIAGYYGDMLHNICHR